MGHWYKAKSINERYGVISDEELIKAIDLTTFDHGETVIIVRSKKKKSQGGPPSGCDQIVTKMRSRQTTRIR